MKIFIAGFLLLFISLSLISADNSQQGHAKEPANSKNEVAFGSIYLPKTINLNPAMVALQPGVVLNKNNDLAGGSILVYPRRFYDNDVIGGTTGIARKITIQNTGSGILALSSISKTGVDTNQFLLNGLPVFPRNISPGDSVSFFVAFKPVSIGIKTAFITINSDDALNPETLIPLRGIGVAAYGSAFEPSLQALLNLLEIEVKVGDDSVSTPVINSDVLQQKAQLLGDEVSFQKFRKAGAGNVTITPLAVFGPTDTAVVGMGWYKSGNAAAVTELFSVSNTPVSNGQTVNVNFTGVLSFDPLTDTFGLFSHWPHFNDRYIYSEDNLNTFSGSAPHHVRVYPYKTNGLVIPDTYLVVFEESTSKLDYNDLIFLVSNVKKVQSNALIFVENLDKFPANDQLVFSRVQTPWSRDSMNYNDNHDSVKARIHNNGISPLIISRLTLSNDTTWKIEKLNNTIYVPGAGLPISINSGAYVDLTLRFTARDQASRVRVLHETLTITSNDDKYPLKIVYLNGLWQKAGEGNSEPYAQEILNTFGYRTQTGFVYTDPDMGDSTKLKGDEIKPSFFVRADFRLPATVRQLSAYHGCCTSTEKLAWYNKGSSTFNNVFTHIQQDGQSVLPRKSLAGTAAGGTINTATAFGLKVGSVDLSDASKNPGKSIGIRVWKAIDGNGVIPDAYIISNDYLGSEATNYDYNDNTYLITNIKPETGTAFYSALSATPSAIDFNEHTLKTTDSSTLIIRSLGKTYSDGSSDPAIVITSVEISGENNSEFSAEMPFNNTLDPQEASSLKIRFNPLSQGLKIADLLIHYNSALSPLRIPLYGIAKTPDTVVMINNRIKSGSTRAITINGKSWSADTSYAFDNLEPYSNPNLSEIAATDDDSLYFTEQSSNGTKKPFRYEIPLANGNYAVRLHFAEIYWGAPGGGIGEEGVRIMSVKLENQLQLINFDIAGEVGTSSAIIKNFTVTVTDGKLNIDFSASVNRPSLSAVEIYSFRSSAPLAVNDLFTFEGIFAGKNVALSWLNTNEPDVKYYEIERSLNNIDFTVLGEVFANASAQYNFIDSNPAPANNFYRLRRVDHDDKFFYSKIIKINVPSVFGMELFPNPAKNKISVQFTGLPANQQANLSVQSVLGSTVRSIPFTLWGRKTDIDISALSPGVYIMRFTGNNFVINRRFIKK